MAVIQISKIQVRRGLQENLPQLASGEMGWSNDERRLWIGNGTLAEGAPLIGNTEILTANSDILSALEAYQFKGDESGFGSQTGLTATGFIERTFGHKLDEQISVRDFGAVGDGSTDDSIALQRAIDQIYNPLGAVYDSIGVRRRIHFPAGIYNLAGNCLVLPSHASIFGDGAQSTVIKHTTGSNVVIKLRDSLRQSDGSLGFSSAILPNQIDITDMSLENQTDDHIVVIDSATTVSFNRVDFEGNSSILTSGNLKAAVRLQGTVSTTQNIYFNESSFANITYAGSINGDVRGVAFNNCYFDNLHQGLNVSATTSSPQSIRVTNSMFDRIAKQAIFSANASSTFSVFNHYRSVGMGNSTDLVGNVANTSVLTWNTSNNYSVGDLFDRDAGNIAVRPLVELLSTTTVSQTSASTSGALQSSPGYALTLTGNVAVAANTGITFTSNTTSILDYTITKGGNYRVGSMRIVQTGGNVIFEDDYSENTDVGVILGFATFGTNAALTYITPSSAPLSNATIKYNIRSFI
jgi:hypothetical protein